MSPDVHALTGAYVLDAVNDIERASFERHLAECGACAQEVHELRETATRLGQAATAEPPAYLKGQVMSAIRTVRQLPPEVAPRSALARHRARSPWALRLTSVAAAAFLVVAAVLGVLLVRERSSSDDGGAYAAALTAILQSPDASVATGKADNGGTATVVFSRDQNRALVLTKDMSPAPSSKDYEAWIIDAQGDMHPAGLLARSGSPTLDLKANDITTAKGFGITLENAGGAQQPNLPPVMQVNFAV